MTESHSYTMNGDEEESVPVDIFVEPEIPYQSFSASTWSQSRDDEIERASSPASLGSKNTPKTGEGPTQLTLDVNLPLLFHAYVLTMSLKRSFRHCIYAQSTLEK